MIALGFVVLAATGACLRALASSSESGFNQHLWTTFALNIGGSFLVGWLHGADAGAILVLGVGGIGTLTTFSTFVGQVECIVREASLLKALGFAGLTVVSGVAAAALGYSL